MKNSKVKAILMSGLLAASMMLMPMSAMAEGEVTALKVQKTVTAEKSVTIPNDVKFTITRVDNADGIKAPDNTKTLTATDLAFTNEKSTGVDIVKNENLTTPEWKAEDAGEYTFEVKEDTSNLTSADGYGWTTVDRQAYYVHVLVDNTGKATYTITKTNTKGDSNKQSEMDFANTYTKKASLSIEKNVPDKTYANPAKTYDITVAFTLPATAPTDFAIAPATGNGVTDSVVSGTTATFRITDGSTAVFSNLPAGTTYTVTEASGDNFTTTFKTIEDGGKESAAASTAANKLVGEGTNKTTVINTYTTITPTGVVTSIAPFIALIAIAAIAIAVYTSMKKRMTR